MTTADSPRSALVRTPIATPSPFVIDVPTLSRGTADRSEDLREPERLLREWSSSRVLTLDGGGAIRLEPSTTRLHTVEALSVADAPPPGAVLLGDVDGVDHWAMRGHVVDGAGLRELGAVLSDTEAGLLTTATALLTWHDAAGFCPRCGLPSVPSPAGWSRKCPRHHEDFPRTDPAVIVLVHDGNESMVLARQPIWPIGRMSVLAGFVEAGESLEHTVAREVLEEVGVRVTDVSYLGSQPWPFPRSLMLGFAARTEPGAPLLPRAGEIEEAHWFDRAAIRRMIAAEAATKGGGDRWLAPRPDGAAPPEGSAFEVILPGPVSIARRMIEGWVASG
jgi:NAD+ diphosphatase